MASLVEGIKEMLRGKDESEHEDRHRRGHDHERHGRESNARYYRHRSPYGEDEERYGNGNERSEYRRGDGRSELSPRKEYRRKSSGYSGSKREDDDNEVIELMVPMCCDKCVEKVEEELGEVEGVESVYCNQSKDRVRITGSDIDTDRCLVKAERAVKKKCELISKDSDDEEEDSHRGSGRRSGHGYVREYESRSGRGSLGRLPSFASGRTVYYDGSDSRGRRQDYEEKDYNGFRRMPSYSKHRHHEAEYITSFNQRPEALDPRRDYYSAGRMPSFNRHRYHDAEYINTGDLDYSPRTFYDRSGGSSYTTPYNERPVYRSQVSFSRLPVGNPSYVKHVEY